MEVLLHSFITLAIHYVTGKLYARGRFTNYAKVHSTHCALNALQNGIIAFPRRESNRDPSVVQPLP